MPAVKAQVRHRENAVLVKKGRQAVPGRGGNGAGPQTGTNPDDFRPPPGTQTFEPEAGFRPAFGIVDAYIVSALPCEAVAGGVRKVSIGTELHAAFAGAIAEMAGNDPRPALRAARAAVAAVAESRIELLGAAGQA